MKEWLIIIIFLFPKVIIIMYFILREREAERDAEWIKERQLVQLACLMKLIIFFGNMIIHLLRGLASFIFAAYDSAIYSKILIAAGVPEDTLMIKKQLYPTLSPSIIPVIQSRHPSYRVQ